MSRPPILALLAAVFIDSLDAGLLVPVLPQLFADPESPAYLLSGPESLSRGYLLLGFVGGAYAVCAFLAGPFLGQLSDRYGRKPLLLVAFTGSAISYALFGLGVAQESIPLIFASRILDGFTGGNILVAQSALADVSRPEDRARVFGTFSAALSLGFVVGPLMGGVLSDPSIVPWFSAELPFWLAAGLGTVSLLVLAVVFRETLDERDDADLSAGLAFTRVREAFADEGLRGPYLTELVFLTGFAFFNSFFNVLLLERLGYGPLAIGVFSSCLGAGFFVVQAFAVEPIKRRLGEVVTVRFALVGVTVAVALVALVQQTWQLYAIIPLLALSNGVIGPNLASLVSRQADADAQGRVLGIRSSVQALGQAPPPFFAGAIANAGSPATPIVVGAVLSAAAAATFFTTVRRDADDDRDDDDTGDAGGSPPLEAAASGRH